MKTRLPKGILRSPSVSSGPMRYTHNGIMPSAATVLDKAVNQISLAEFKELYVRMYLLVYLSEERRRR